MQLKKQALRSMPLSLLFCITLALLNSCGTLIKVPVAIKDEDLYYLKEASDSEWAVHMHFLSTGSDQITKDAWDKMSQGMVSMPLAAFEDFNTEIGKLCSQVPCNYEVMKKLNNFFSRLRSVSEAR